LLHFDDDGQLVKVEKASMDPQNSTNLIMQYKSVEREEK
jgi:hypothetical protein